MSHSTYDTVSLANFTPSLTTFWLNQYSKPTRIDEAAPHLKLVLEQYDKVHQGKEGGVVPLLYLGVALHKVTGNEEEPLKAFQDGFRYNKLLPDQTGPGKRE